MKNSDLEPPTSLLQLIPKTKENKFFYDNGLSKVIPRLTLKVHTKIEDCQILWNKFSPNKSIFQLWDFRYAWHQGYRRKPLFFTLYERKKVLGTLPLWFNEDDKKYEWFGGYWPEDNIFFVEDQNYIPLLLKISPRPISLLAILPESLDGTQQVVELTDDEVKYTLDTSSCSSINQVLAKLSKKHRQNLRREFNKFNSYPLKIEWNDAYNKELLDDLVALSEERFGVKGKNASTFVDIRRVATFEHLFKNKGLYKLYFLLVKIQNRLALIDIVGIYKKTYHLLIGGANDTCRFPGIGVFITYFEFEDAIRRGMQTIDVLQFDNNWKHKYFTPKKMLKFEKR